MSLEIVFKWLLPGSMSLGRSRWCSRSYGTCVHSAGRVQEAGAQLGQVRTDDLLVYDGHKVDDPAWRGQRDGWERVLAALLKSER